MVFFRFMESAIERTKWDSNWDHREPESLSRVRLEEKFEIVTASRHLMLVRHGQYYTNSKSDEERRLTCLGREQARLTGLRLKELGLPYSLIVQSTMFRATETAQIIANQLPNVPLISCNLLREGAPVDPDPPSEQWTPSAHRVRKDSTRIEVAFNEYFHRADSSQKTDSYEVLVCHSNVIRYFLCRALQLPPEAWLRFSLFHGSTTWLCIGPTGRVSVSMVGDIGHMPAHLMST